VFCCDLLHSTSCCSGSNRSWRMAPNWSHMTLFIDNLGILHSFIAKGFLIQSHYWLIVSYISLPYYIPHHSCLRVVSYKKVARNIKGIVRPKKPKKVLLSFTHHHMTSWHQVNTKGHVVFLYRIFKVLERTKKHSKVIHLISVFHGKSSEAIVEDQVKFKF